MMTRVEKRRKRFIELMVDAISPEEELIAYKTVYPNCKSDKSAMTACGRLLKNVDIQRAIETEKIKREEEIKEAKRKERIRKALDQVATQEEIDAKLSAIALGVHKRNRKVPVYNRESKKYEILSIQEEPTESDIVAAADKLYRRKGAYAPMAIKHEGGDKFIEMLKLISQRRNK